MERLEVGDNVFYRGGGEVLRVRVTHSQEETHGNTPGVGYGFKILKVVESKLRGEERPRVGLEFSAWKAIGGKDYSGWDLNDDRQLSPKYI